MNLLPRWMWMTSEAMRHDDRAPEPDPGDMGTAFGLDASLASPDEERAIAASPASDSRWQQRLDRRPLR